MGFEATGLSLMEKWSHRPVSSYGHPDIPCIPLICPSIHHLSIISLSFFLSIPPFSGFFVLLVLLMHQLMTLTCSICETL